MAALLASTFASILVAAIPTPASAAVHISVGSWDAYVTQTPTDGLKVYSAFFGNVLVTLGGFNKPYVRVEYPDGTVINDQLQSILNGDAGSGDGNIDVSQTSWGVLVSSPSSPSLWNSSVSMYE